MKIDLTNHISENTYEYTITYNEIEHPIRISFRNKTFHSVLFKMDAPYDRDDWKVLSMVDTLIRNLEKKIV